MKWRNISWGGPRALAVGGIALALCVTERGEACEPLEPEPAYADLGEVVPLDGATDVALDGPVLVGLNFYGAEDYMEANITLTNVESGEVVTGSTSREYWNGYYLRFHPEQPLAPNATYSLEATIMPSIERVAEATGSEQRSSVFTTSDHELPALTLDGEPEVELQDHEAPDYTSCDPGSCVCDPVGTIAQTSAVVQLPTLQGGYADLGYSVSVEVSAKDGTEPVTRSAATRIVASGQPAQVDVTYLKGEQAYTPCFAISYIDVVGHSLRSDTLCLDDATVLALGADAVALADAGAMVETKPVAAEGAGDAAALPAPAETEEPTVATSSGAAAGTGAPEASNPVAAMTSSPEVNVAAPTTPVSVSESTAGGAAATGSNANSANEDLPVAGEDQEDLSKQAVDDDAKPGGCAFGVGAASPRAGLLLVVGLVLSRRRVRSRLVP